MYILLSGSTPIIPQWPEKKRELICNPRIIFQGEYFNSKTYGTIPVFGPESSVLPDDELISYIKHLKSLGATHIEFAISWNYSERDYSYPVQGRDLSNNLSELARRMKLALNLGCYCALFMAGDGMSEEKNPDGSYPYNDPQGWTYGWNWLMDNFERIYTELEEVRDYTLFVPGYDAVFYGWGDDPASRVKEFGDRFREVYTNGCLGIEHDVGHIPVGEGGSDYQPGGRMAAYDTVLGEFDQNNLHGDNVWQILGRMCRPYNRPPDQVGDPDPPMYLVDSERGPRFYIIYEYDTFPWVRGRISQSDVYANAAYLKSLAPNNQVC